MPHIAILATGGTIAGTADARSPGAYTAGRASIEELLAAAPGLDAHARISAEQVSAVGSQDMNESIWLALAARIDTLLAREDVNGVVVTHGTDTLEETALFLDLVAASPKPVVLVGAMRPSTALSADGPLNLLEAVTVAAAPESRGRGVLAVLNDLIHGARDVTKTSTSGVQTFQSPNFGPLGQVTPGRVTFLRPPAPRLATYPLPVEAPLPRVSIIYAHAGMDGTDVQGAVAAGARGLVLAGVGAGNASHTAFSALADAVKAGLVVVRASRTGIGPVLRNIEVNDDAHGFIASGFFNPAKARVLLQLLIANGITAPDTVQQAFNGSD